MFVDPDWKGFMETVEKDITNQDVAYTTMSNEEKVNALVTEMGMTEAEAKAMLDDMGELL
jgi:hypothetical protein